MNLLPSSLLLFITSRHLLARHKGLDVKLKHEVVGIELEVGKFMMESMRCQHDVNVMWCSVGVVWCEGECECSVI